MILPDKKTACDITDPTEIIIRPMTDEDIKPFCILFQNVFSKAPWNENWTVSKINAGITRQMRKNGFVGMVAAIHLSNIGYLTGFRLWQTSSVFYLDQLFISTEYQGLKTGKRLLAETEQHLKSLGVCFIVLLTKPGSYVENFYIKNEYKPFLRQIHIRGKSILYKHITLVQIKSERNSSCKETKKF